MKTLTGKPCEDKFYMPAEFDKHKATLVLWPERRDVWRNGARPAQLTTVELIKAIVPFEKVIVGVTRDQFMNAKSLLPEEVSVIEISYDDAWIRDTAPSFITNGQVIRGVDWNFNSWGGLNGGSYFPWMLDDLVPQKVLEWFNIDRYKANITLEGGAIHVDGEGTLIATKECILNKNRNPDKKQTDIENIFYEYLGVEKVIWLEKGLHFEENNGHIDNMCAFIKPGEVFLAWTNDKNDPQYEISKNAFEVLSSQKDAKGRRLKIRKLILPEPMYITDKECQGIEKSLFAIPRNTGDRLAASYTNYYFINGGVVIPQFSCREDEYALRKFEEAFPDRNIIQIYAREFLIGGGGIHCMTMQMPGN